MVSDRNFKRFLLYVKLSHLFIFYIFFIYFPDLKKWSETEKISIKIKMLKRIREIQDKKVRNKCNKQ